MMAGCPTLSVVPIAVSPDDFAGLGAGVVAAWVSAAVDVVCAAGVVTCSVTVLVEPPQPPSATPIAAAVKPAFRCLDMCKHYPIHAHEASRPSATALRRSASAR